jgi:hypothetical protein
MLSIVISTIVFFVASFFIKRQFDDMDLPKGMTRSLMVFCLAVAVAYGTAAAIDWVAGHT